MTAPVWHRIEVGVLPDAGVEIDHNKVQRAIGEAVGPWTLTYGFRVEAIVPRVPGRQDQPLHLRWSDNGTAIRRWGNEPFADSRTYYPATCLETAACVWEAVLDMEQYEGTGSLSTGSSAQRAFEISACRSNLGSSHLRLACLEWVDAIDAAWRAADVDEDHPRGGAYPRAFDWEFVPEWIAANVDWSDPSGPKVRS